MPIFFWVHIPKQELNDQNRNRPDKPYYILGWGDSRDPGGGGWPPDQLFPKKAPTTSVGVTVKKGEEMGAEVVQDRVSEGG